MPGLSTKELEIGVEPHRLTISGKRVTSKKATSKKTIYKDHCLAWHHQARLFLQHVVDFVLPSYDYYAPVVDEMYYNERGNEVLLIKRLA